jgi:hypothetical protein
LPDMFILAKFSHFECSSFPGADHFRGGISLSRHSLRATTLPALASSTTFRVRGLGLTVKKLLGGSGGLIQGYFGLTYGVSHWPGLKGRTCSFFAVFSAIPYPVTPASILRKHLKSSSPQISREDMEIISANFIDPMISAGPGKIFAILGRAFLKEIICQVQESEFLTTPEVVCACSLGFPLSHHYRGVLGWAP